MGFILLVCERVSVCGTSKFSNKLFLLLLPVTFRNLICLSFQLLHLI